MSKPSRLTLTVACSTVLAAGAAGAIIARPGHSAAQSAVVTDDLVAARAAGIARPSGPGAATRISTYRAQHAHSEVTVAVAAQLAARAAARARAARLAAARAAAAQQAAAQQAAASQPAAAPPPPAAVPVGTAQQIAASLLGSYGWSSSQFSCLDDLWSRESGWRTTAANPSGAYGIPQALPGSKMASAGPNWQTDATTQIRWGLGYIKGTYGSPCSAWSHEEATGWY